MYDVIVIGAGAAGMTSALYALRNSKTVLVLESESLGGQIANSPRLENYPSIRMISGEEFADNLFNQIMLAFNIAAPGWRNGFNFIAFV